MGITKIEQITNDDLPALLRISNRVSDIAQKRFLGLTYADMAALIFAAILGSLTLNNALDRVAIAVSTVVILTISVAFAVVIRISRLEQQWYDGRAVAESIKTLAWRYITCSEPYSSKLNDKADQLFLSDVLSLLKQRETFSATLGGKMAMEQQITNMMKQARKLDVEERKRLYLSQRIYNQREWYSDKAEDNLKAAERAFIAVVISHILAILSALTLILWPNSFINPTGIFTTIAVAALTWVQMRRHQGLAQSYGLAAQELGIIYEQANSIQTEDTLSEYVINSENAISREHTLWLARRR